MASAVLVSRFMLRPQSAWTSHARVAHAGAPPRPPPPRPCACAASANAVAARTAIPIAIVARFIDTSVSLLILQKVPHCPARHAGAAAGSSRDGPADDRFHHRSFHAHGHAVPGVAAATRDCRHRRRPPLPVITATPTLLTRRAG